MNSLLYPDHWKSWASSAFCQATLVAVGTAILLAVIVRDMGPTTDEITYIECNQQMEQWAADLPRLGLRNFSTERLRQGWPFACATNKSLTVPALCAEMGRLTIGRFDEPLQSWRWGNILLFAATAGLIFGWLRHEFSPAAAVVGVAALLGTPRLLGNACLFSVDPVVGCFWVWSSWALVQACRIPGWKWPFVFALLAAGGIASKPSFWFAVPVWMVWGLIYHRRCWRPLITLVTVTPVTVFLLCPMWWTSPIDGVLNYYDVLTAPQGWEGVDAYYLGEIYQMPGTPPVPWHAVPVQTAVTIPLWIAALFLVGCYRWTCFLPRNEVVFLWLASTAVLPFVVMLPQTPGHDGVRLFLTSFFFVPLVAGCGFSHLIAVFTPRSQESTPAATTPVATDTDSAALRTAPRRGWLNIRTLGAATFVAASAWTTVRSHPGELSYYNTLVGGWPGAAEPVRQSMTSPVNPRPQFELSFWWEAMRLQDWRDMQAQLPAGAKLWIYPDYIGLKQLNDWGVVRSDIHFTRPQEKPDYSLIYGRLGRITAVNADPQGTKFFNEQPVWERRVNGVRVAALFRLH